MSIAARRMQRAVQTEVGAPSLYTFGFEAGVAGATVAAGEAAAGDTPWTAVGIASGASMTYDGTHTAQGASACKLVSVADSVLLRWTTQSSYQGAYRYYVWWPSNPTQDMTIVWFGSDTSTKLFHIALSSSGALRGYIAGQVNSVFSSGNNELLLGTWVRIECAFSVNADDPANGAVRFAMYQGESTNAEVDSGWIGVNLGALPATILRVGKYGTTANTTTHWLDSVAYKPGALDLLGPTSSGGNSVPVANAGPDQSVTTGATVVLNGAGSYDSDGTISSYSWAQTAGTAVTLTNATSANPSFTAPASASTLTFSLTVTDNDGATSTADTVSIAVTPASSFVRQSSLAGSAAVGSRSYTIPGANTVFVATTGNDTSGSGTIGSPYQTLKKAATVAPANSTIIMRAGEYHEGGVWWRAEDATAQGNTTLGGIMFANNGVTVQNYPGEAVWFDGSVVVSGWTFDGTNWRKPFVTKFDHTQTHTRGQDSTSWPGGGGFVPTAYPNAADPEQVFYDGAQLTQVSDVGNLGPGKFCVEGAMYGGSGVDKNVFITTAYVMRDNPTGHEIRISNLSRLATVTKASITVRGIGIRRYAPALVDFGALYVSGPTSTDGFVMEHCIIEDISVLGVNQGASNAIYRYLTVRRCGQGGLSPKGQSDGSIIEYCLFDKNVYTRFNYGPDAGAIKLTAAWNYIIRHNRFIDTYGHALWFDVSCYQNSIYGNDFIRSYGHGIAYEISAKAYIVDNYFEDIGLSSDIRTPPSCNPIWISGSNNCQVWNNTVINSEILVKIAQDYRTPTAPNAIDRYGRDSSRPAAFYDGSNPAYEHNGQMTWTVTNVVVKNNILYNPTGMNDVSSVFVALHDDSNGVLRTKRNTIDFGIHTGGNLYNRLSSSGTPRFANGVTASGGVEIYSNMTGNATLYPGGASAPSWKTITGETGSVFVDNSDATTTSSYPYTVKSAVLSTITPQSLDSITAGRTERTPGQTHVGAWLE